VTYLSHESRPERRRRIVVATADGVELFDESFYN
jgi:hypothetical protein